MSTFKGIIAEFPQIRIDYFRQQQEFKPPLACFLSHVHSDHLVGLESMRAPFVYCSAATKEILLRLEKYHYRINFAKGILESRNVTYDRSMRRLAKPLPLDTPTTIELAPGNSIRVTLIDANHCVGAVMFLIEGGGKAILYTGDIRAETWWVNSLVQNPALLPYALGRRRLDCMYLDTTFATKREPYKDFPSKAEGIKELLEAVSQYPDDTVFYFHSWTFGYENVWLALSTFLGSRIHLDSYRASIYGSLSTLEKRHLREIGLHVLTDNKSLRESGLEVREATALCGFRNGNHIQPGCLTSQESVRIHSCERGMGCRVIDEDTQAKVVHIIPIITRTNGIEIAELGAGGGKGDLEQKEEYETGSIAELGKLMELCAQCIKDEKLLAKVLALLNEAFVSNEGKLDLGMQLQKAVADSQDSLSLHTFVTTLSVHATKSATMEEPCNRTIRFPYSRHSSYSELCELVAAFQPQDIFPCTVDEANWTPDMSMQSLFGHCCRAHTFRHDVELSELYDARMQQRRSKRSHENTQEDTQTSNDQISASQFAIKRLRTPLHTSMPIEAEQMLDIDEATDATETQRTCLHKSPSAADLSKENNHHPAKYSAPPRSGTVALSENVSRVQSPASASKVPEVPCSKPTKKTKKWTNKQLAYEAAIGTCLSWAEFGGLTSTQSGKDREEEDL